MGKTADLFKKIRDTKGTFHAKMGLIKDRNGMDLTEVEYVKKRWQEYTEELYKKDLRYTDNHDDVITHLEPDILECEVKWALESITTNKVSGGDGIPVERFPTPKAAVAGGSAPCSAFSLHCHPENSTAALCQDSATVPSASIPFNRQKLAWEYQGTARMAEACKA